MKALIHEGNLKIERADKSFSLKTKRNSLQKDLDLSSVNNCESSAIPQQLNRLQRLSALASSRITGETKKQLNDVHPVDSNHENIAQSDSVVDFNTSTAKALHLRSKRVDLINLGLNDSDILATQGKSSKLQPQHKRSNSIDAISILPAKLIHLSHSEKSDISSNLINYSTSADEGKDDYSIHLIPLINGSPVNNNTDKQIGNRHLMQVIQSAASSQPRGAQFVEVEMHKNCHDYVEGKVQTDFACSNGKDSTSEKTINVVIHNEMRAAKNDRILLEKLMEAKSMSRKNEMGAVMHKFALWGNRTISDATGDTVQVDIKSGNSSDAAAVEKTPEEGVNSNSLTPKLPRKLKGPLAAREALGLGLSPESISSKRDRFDKLDKPQERMDIEEGDYLEFDEELNQINKNTSTKNCLQKQQLGQGHARLASHLRSMVGQAKSLSTSSSAGSDALKEFLPSSMKIASELAKEGVPDDVIRETICDHLQRQMVGIIDIGTDLGDQLLEHNLASLSSEEQYDENSFCVDTAIISFEERPKPSLEDDYSEIAKSDSDLSSVEEEEEMRVKMRAGRIDSATSGSTAGHSNRRDNVHVLNDQDSLSALTSFRTVETKPGENEGIIKCCSNCPGAAVNTICNCLRLSGDSCGNEHTFSDECNSPNKCSEAMVSPSNENTPIQSIHKAITVKSEQKSSNQELFKRDINSNRRY